MTSFLVLCLLGQAVLLIVLLGALIKKGDRIADAQKTISLLELIRQENAALAASLQNLQPLAKKEPVPERGPAQKTEPKEYEAIRRAFNEGAEFSRDPDSEYLIDNLHDIFEALHRFGVVFMWVNDTRHEIRAHFNPNDTLYGETA